MAEPIAVEENLDEGSMPEPRNFICGVVEGEIMENPNIPNTGPIPSEDKIDNEPSTVSLLQLSDNPWRRGCGEKWDKVADWTEQPPVYYAIEALHLLNKLSESNFETIASKFCSFQNEHSDNMEKIANLFFTKSISEPLYTKLYCCLLKKLFDSKETNKNALNLILLISTQCNLIIFSSANKEFDLEEKNIDQMKLEGTFSLYYELYNLNLVTLSSFLMILFGFLQSSKSNNLPFVAQVIQKCGEKVERDVCGKKRGETLVWTQILDLIESKCKLQKDFLTRRTYLMLSNILLLKERSWETALTKSVTNDDAVCEIVEQAPQKRPGKKERKEKQRLAMQQKALVTNDVPEKEEGFFSFLREQATPLVDQKALVTKDVPACKNEEQVPQKRPSKKERREERKEKENGFFPSLQEQATPLVDTRNKKLKKNDSKVEEEKIVLNSCDDPWKPIFIRMMKMKRKEQLSLLSSHELVMMNAKSLLNKLDVDNYGSISKQFLELDFKEKNVGLIIDYLLIKASNEGGLYGEKYAELIREMYDLVKLDSKQNETVFASNTILKRSALKKIKSGVQNVLEQVNYYLIPLMKQDLDDPDTGMNMDLQNQLINALLFIGALFKQDLVEMKQVLSTICMNLIQEVSEIYLESLVIFLSKVGKKIDDTRNEKSFTVFRSEWNKVMTVIDTAIAERSNISNKTYFMLLNFVDLSRREWVPRVVHIAEPQFSASGLVEREKLRFKDVRDKQNISLYYAKELNFLNVSKDPWQRGCFKRKQNEEVLQVKKLKTILNQINGDNFESCSFQFNRRCKMKKENIDLYVCLVFEQCMSNSKYIDIFLKLIRSHVAYKVETKGSEKEPGLDEFAFIDLFVEKSILTFNEHKTRGKEHDVLLNNCTVIAKLFTFNLVNLNVLLDLLMNFLDHPTELTFLYLAKIVLFCGREIEQQVQQKENIKIKWMEIVKGIEIRSVSSREEISNRTYLMLTNVMIMKNKNWVSKTNLGTDVATECRWKRDLDEITTETKWKPRTKQHQTRHVRNEKEENIADKDKELNERKDEFMVQNILKDLDMVDNPWRRGEFKRELTEKERIIMEAKTLLNKLAENNFQSIVDQFCKLIFLPGTIIEPIVNTLFVKGILETKFTELHAKFLKSVSDNMNNMATGGTKVVAKEETEIVEGDKAVEFDLRTRILNKCAMEIYYLHSESNVISDEIYHQKRLNLDMTRPDFEELIKYREKNDFLMHHRESLKKKISVGTCHFLGELYNADVVDTGFILTTIVCDLLPYDSEESLECAIKLISVVGKKLERVIKKSLNKDYLAGWDIVLEDIATKASRRDQWSNRIYFMLLDLMDLKERDWLPRLIIIPTRQFKAPKKSRGY